MANDRAHLLPTVWGTNFEKPPAVIFTTAFGDHALAAFQAHAVDYLLKPVRRDRLEEALTRSQKLNRAQLLNVETDANEKHARTHISVLKGGNIALIPVGDIIYFKADQKYVTVCSTRGEELIDEPLKALEEEFGNRFIRIHRKFLVAASCIIGMEKTSTDHYEIKLRSSNERLEVSRRHVATVRRTLKTINT